MAAGLAMLNYLNTHPEVYTHLENITARICEGFEKNLKELGIKGTVNRIGSMFTLFFTDQKVKDFEAAKTSDTAFLGDTSEQCWKKEFIWLPLNMKVCLFQQQSLKSLQKR